MTSDANVESVRDSHTLTDTGRMTFGMLRADWLRLGRCVLWCYLPMLILHSLSIFRVPVETSSSLWLVAAFGLWTLGDYLIGMRAEPIIDAVGKYVAVHGSPPASVQSLFPAYLDAIPNVGSRVSISKSMTLSGYNPGWWYVSVDLPKPPISTTRTLVFSSAGRKGIFSSSAESFGRWTLCTER